MCFHQLSTDYKEERVHLLVADIDYLQKVKSLEHALQVRKHLNKASQKTRSMEVPSQILAHVAAITAAGLAVAYAMHTMLVTRDLSILSSANYTAYKITAAMLEAARKAYMSKASATITIELNQPFEFEIDENVLYIREVYVGNKKIAMEFNLPRIAGVQYKRAVGKCYIITVTALYSPDSNNVEVSVSPG